LLVDRELRRAYPEVATETAADAAELARALDRGGFDLVITDYRLRWTDGLTILRDVKARYPDTPVIMYTGTGNEEVAAEGLRSGLDDYVIKTPGKLIRLAASVAVTLDRRAARDARRAAEAERDRLLRAARFLAEASARLAGSLEYERTLADVAALVVPTLADWCFVDVRDDRGEITRVAVTHDEPAKEDFARRLRGVTPAVDGPHPVARALETGEPQLVPEVTDAWLVSIARDPDHLGRLRTLGPRSYLCVPMNARGRTIGTVTLVVTRGDRRYGEADVPLARELADRAAIAVDNAALYRAARGAVRARDEFLLRASHELRTPLTAIRGALVFVRRAIQGRTAESPVELLEIGERNAMHMTRLVDDLLDAATLQAGVRPLAVQRVALGTLLDQVAAQLGPVAREKRLELTVRADEGMAIEADPFRLEQLFTNLVANAVKFTGEGGSVVVQARRLGDEAVEVRVRDSGIGLAPEQLERVFEPFYQGSPGARPGVARGTGLGLTIAKGLAELHGGDIRAESAGPGCGSTFVVTLPRAARARAGRAA
jgi:signal transduction histidine kinase/ActR/RegA family two-component response regulator